MGNDLFLTTLLFFVLIVLAVILIPMRITKMRDFFYVWASFFILFLAIYLGVYFLAETQKIHDHEKCLACVQQNMQWMNGSCVYTNKE